MSFMLTPSAARGLATFDPSEQTRLCEIWTEHGISPSMMAYLETRDPTATPPPQWPDVIEYQAPMRESWMLPVRAKGKASRS